MASMISVARPSPNSRSRHVGASTLMAARGSWMSSALARAVTPGSTASRTRWARCGSANAAPVAVPSSGTRRPTQLLMRST